MYSILLVDDEKTIREYLPIAIPFEEYGFKVTGTARNGQEALDKLSAIKPDLILLDIRMPVVDGLQFLEILRQGEFSDTLVIVLSGYKDFEYAKEAMKYGVKFYLNKPVDEEEIIPLLKEVHKELDRYNEEKSFELLRKHINVLNDLYNGVDENEEVLRGYTLMTCVPLPRSQDFKCDRPYLLMQQCLSKAIGGFENYLFRTDNSQITLMLPYTVFEPFSNSKELFADNLLGVFDEHKINCSLLFDSYIFEHRENTFKEDFTNHMNRMLTELFFSSAKFIEYNPSQFKISEKLCFESRYMDEIKQYFSLCNEDELLKVIEKLVAEIQRIHLDIYHVKEISYRIYYIFRDELLSADAQDQITTIPDFPELLDYPYFILFDQWKELLFSLIHTSLDVIKYRCKMAKLGISREVIDYVQMHYKEQITLKQIANKFFVNATYLGRAFRKATGMNFNQYVNQLRITEAKKLLLHTDKLIYEIASEVGYSESKYFIVKFTEEVGKSPKEYRNQIV